MAGEVVLTLKELEAAMAVKYPGKKFIKLGLRQQKEVFDYALASHVLGGSDATRAQGIPVHQDSAQQPRDGEGLLDGSDWWRRFFANQTGQV
jgi:hypothetical protein